MIKVNGNLFRAAMAFASIEETRYYLNGVYIEPHEKGALLVATDGHRLVCVHDADALCESPAIVQLPKVMLRALVPDLINKDDEDEWGDETTVAVEDKPRMLLIKASGHALIEGVVRSASSVLIDGKYPDWRKVVTKFAEATGPLQSFNAEYLVAFSKMAGMLGDSNRRITIVPGADAEGPALILFPGTRNAFAVLMPVKNLTKFEPRVPDFFQPTKAAAA